MLQGKHTLLLMACLKARLTAKARLRARQPKPNKCVTAVELLVSEGLTRCLTGLTRPTSDLE